MQFTRELRSGLTCHRVAAKHVFADNFDPIGNIPRLVKAIQRTIVPKEKTRRGCRGRGNEQREESDILWYASARTVLFQGRRREKDRDERAGEGGLRSLGMKGREVVREKRRRRRGRRDEKWVDEMRRRHDNRRGGKRKIHRLSFSFAFRVSGELRILKGDLIYVNL